MDISYRDDTFPYAGGWDYEIKERTFNLDVELYWHVNNWLDAGLSLSHWDRDANDPYYEYLDNKGNDHSQAFKRAGVVTVSLCSGC